MTSPRYAPELNTFENIVSSGLTVTTITFYFPLITNSSYTLLWSLAPRTKEITTYEQAFSRVTNERDTILVADSILLDHTRVKESPFLSRWNTIVRH